MFNSKKLTEQVTEHVPSKSKSPIKTVALVLGALVGISHIGLLGYVLRPQEPVQQPPTFNLPRGPYSSYRIKAGKDGYEIEYRANDPKVLESERSLDVDRNKRGLFGGGSEKRTEYRRDQYTMDGTRNIGGGATTEEGKSAKEVECLIADAGARSQGAMAGTALASGLAAPALASIPYVGWLAGGWALLLGQQVGETIGSEVGSAFNDC
ncbi:hypothetical protein PQC12_gp208 [Synechococcus phage S-SCSM1]|uniref:Uncharacterized protein n=1 Tax=Synechococcus phage S-SCSM1 TaxID=2588487 RepID=A0A6M2ZJ44_9CAUD|nr:hypothetical protein PQC12_gp208 [Synechococcus phage S-SCSM1]QFG06425.1 hypothetical protein SSCSM1_164 [Synechococcus phage S-SCSM1]